MLMSDLKHVLDINRLVIIWNNGEIIYFDQISKFPRFDLYVYHIDINVFGYLEIFVVDQEKVINKS